MLLSFRAHLAMEKVNQVMEKMQPARLKADKKANEKNKMLLVLRRKYNQFLGFLLLVAGIFVVVATVELAELDGTNGHWKLNSILPLVSWKILRIASHRGSYRRGPYIFKRHTL